jgi:hypothetical protein
MAYWKEVSSSMGSEKVIRQQQQGKCEAKFRAVKGKHAPIHAGGSKISTNQLQIAP